MKTYFKTILRKYKAAIKFAETHRKPEVLEYLVKRNMETGLCALLTHSNQIAVFRINCINTMCSYRNATINRYLGVGYWWPTPDYAPLYGQPGQKRTRDIISKCLKPRVKFLEDLIKTL